MTPGFTRRDAIDEDVARRVYDRLGFRVVAQRDAAEDASGVSINMRLEFA